MTKKDEYGNPRRRHHVEREPRDGLLHVRARRQRDGGDLKAVNSREAKRTCREAQPVDLGTTCGFGHTWPGVGCDGVDVIETNDDMMVEAAPTVTVEEGERMARVHACSSSPRDACADATRSHGRRCDARCARTRATTRI